MCLSDPSAEKNLWPEVVFPRLACPGLISGSPGQFSFTFPSYRVIIQMSFLKLYLEIYFMSFKIIVDSCCDLTPLQFRQGPFLQVPLTISLPGTEIVDDATLDQGKLLQLMCENSEAPKTACPSP